MAINEKEIVPTAEELALEKEATTEAKDDEIRAKIVSDFSFDEEKDKERIDKLFNKEKDSRKKLSDAIGQKIKYRGMVPKPAENAGAQKQDEKKNDLSQDDMFVLVKSDVHMDDVNEVKDYAKLKGISIAEALKSPIVQGILTTNTEHRKSAAAAGTKDTRSTSKTDGVAIVSDILAKGEDAVPEKGSEGAMELFKQRNKGKKF